MMARRRSGSRQASSKPVRRSEEFWRGLIAEQSTTGESAREICERFDLNPRTLRWWRWRLRDEPHEIENTAGEFLAVRVIPEALPVGTGVEVILGGGRRIQVSPGFSPEVLAQVVAILEQTP